MKKFSNLAFVYGDLRIVPLLKIDDVQRAGELMHHCIYKTESYWQKETNLLFGTYENGKLIETTQYSLEDFEILHSYGVHNVESKHHKTIIGILKTGKQQIKVCLRPKKKPIRKNNKVLQVA